MTASPRFAEQSILGKVLEVWRHPVKSVQGYPADAIVVESSGVVCDRVFAVQDVTSSQLVTLATSKRLLHVATQPQANGNAEPELLLPGSMQAVPLRDADAALSVWLGRDVRIVRRADVPEAALFDYGLPVADLRYGRFNDVAGAVHVVSAASLRWLDGATADNRRTRANIVVDLGDQPFTEHQLVGAALRMGDVVLEVSETTVRCELMDASHPGIAAEPGSLDRVRTETDGVLGIYAHVRAPGRIAPGDPLALVGAA